MSRLALIVCATLACAAATAAPKKPAGREKTQPCILHGYHDHLMFFCAEKMIQERRLCERDVLGDEVCYLVTPLGEADIRALSQGVPIEQFRGGR